MPTYDYECSKCGHTFDAFQNMSDEPLKKCPECSQNALKRLIGGGLGVIFKGSGFYVTDSRSGGSKKSAAVTSDATSSDSKKNGSESKTASAPSEGSGKKDGGSSSGKSEKVAG
jgi:putative FmdB family regulatory protein